MSFLHKLVWHVGSRFRNPSIFSSFQRLMASQHLSREQLIEQQQKDLHEFLKFVVAHSPYYKKKYKDVGLGTDQTQFTLEYFSRLPVINKTELIAHNKDIHTGFDFTKCFTCETSGTSGQTLVFRRNEEWDSFNRAIQMRGYSWHGVNIWDKNIYLWGYNFTFYRKLISRIQDLFLNRFRIFGFSDLEIRSILKRIYRVRYISGYSSVIYEIIRKLEGKIDRSKLKLKMIKGTSEKIHPHYSSLSEKVLGLPIISEYGSAESGIIAFSCRQGNMHINMEGVIVETDEENEIIVTNLHSRSFPIIRYKLGDSVRLAPEDYYCPCGLAHPVIEDVNGRVGRVVIGKTKEYPSLYFYYIFKNLYFKYGLSLQYQFHQHEPGILSLWLTNPVSDETEGLIFKEFMNYFYDDVQLTIKVEKELYRNKGKLSDFITALA